MWKILRDRAQGTSHKISNTVCQDSELHSIFKFGDKEYLLLCCSDGAGSASLSDKGSELACLTLSHSVEAEFANGKSLEDVTRETIVSWYECATKAIQEEAQKLGTGPRELACTLLGAVIGSMGALFFQLGDGGIVILSENEYSPVFWPQNGEHVNETNFLTDQDLAQHVLFKTTQSSIQEIALFTDGLQPLVLDYKLKSAHAPFFRQMFTTLRQGSEHDLCVPFSQFLNSSTVNDRTDDDKSLILAVWIDDDAADTL